MGGEAKKGHVSPNLLSSSSACKGGKSLKRKRAVERGSGLCSTCCFPRLRCLKWVFHGAKELIAFNMQHILTDPALDCSF